ncbi:hypothetical protein Tco_0780771 [Tanacetum coccineum]
MPIQVDKMMERERLLFIKIKDARKKEAFQKLSADYSMMVLSIGENLQTITHSWPSAQIMRYDFNRPQKADICESDGQFTEHSSVIKCSEGSFGNPLSTLMRVAKPAWNNANRVNRANNFVPRTIQLNAVRAFVNTGRANINSGRANINTVRANGNWGTAVKTSACYNWRNSRPNSNCDSGATFIRTDHPLKNMGDRGIFDSVCSGHMTGNKDHLDDLRIQRGICYFGGSKVNNGKRGQKAGKTTDDFRGIGCLKSIGKRLGEETFSPSGLQAAETLVQVASQKTKTYTRKVKSGLKKKLDVGVSSGDRKSAFEKFKSASEEIELGFTILVLVMSESAIEKERKDYAKKMVELVEKRRREIREQKLKAKKNKPMTQAEQRNYMMNYVRSHNAFQSRFMVLDNPSTLRRCLLRNPQLKVLRKRSRKVLEVEEIPIPGSAKF